MEQTLESLEKNNRSSVLDYQLPSEECLWGGGKSQVNSLEETLDINIDEAKVKLI